MFTSTLAPNTSGFSLVTLDTAGPRIVRLEERSLKLMACILAGIAPVLGLHDIEPCAFRPRSICIWRF